MPVEKRATVGLLDSVVLQELQVLVAARATVELQVCADLKEIQDSVALLVSAGLLGSVVSEELQVPAVEKVSAVLLESAD